MRDYEKKRTYSITSCMVSSSVSVGLVYVYFSILPSMEEEE